MATTEATATDVSPLEELRNRFGLSIPAMAGALGVPYDKYYKAERGNAPLPRMARKAFADLGVDWVELEDRQQDWLQANGARLRAELKARLGIG